MDTPSRGVPEMAAVREIQAAELEAVVPSLLDVRTSECLVQVLGLFMPVFSNLKNALDKTE